MLVYCLVVALYRLNCRKYRTSGGFRGGAQGACPPPPFVEYLQKIYKKVTEMSIQKPF